MTPSAEVPASASLVKPVPQTHVLARLTEPIATLLYSPAMSTSAPPLLAPANARRCTAHSEPHSTTMTVLVAAARLVAPPLLRLQLMVCVPEGKRRT